MSVDEIYTLPESVEWNAHTIRIINKMSENIHKNAIFFQYVTSVPDKLDFGVITIKDDGGGDVDSRNAFIKTGKGNMISLMVTGTGGNSSYHHKIVDDDDDTFVSVEESADEDIIRMEAGGTQVGYISSGNIAFGSGALTLIESGGVNNIAIGVNAGKLLDTADNNIAIGENALSICDVTCSHLIAIGTNALKAYDASFSDNIAIGEGALEDLIQNNENLAIGSFALRNVTTGGNNTAIGHFSLDGSITASNFNCGLGGYTLSNVNSGDYNTAAGENAGRYIANGSTALNTANNCVFLGYKTMGSADSITNEIVIGYQAIGKGTNTVHLGSSAIIDTYLEGNVHIDNIGKDLDMGDFDIHSIDGLYGYDDNVYIDMGADGRIVIQADGAGTPFSTPDIDITGTTYFDDHIGLALDKQIQFGDDAVYIFSDDDGHLDVVADISIDLNSVIVASNKLIATPDEITATSEGVAASINTINTEVTTNGDSDLDNVTLANGTSGQIKNIYCVVEGNAADTWKITPATMCGGTQITFSGVGEGCTLVYADSEGWVITANNGGTVS